MIFRICTDLRKQTGQLPFAIYASELFRISAVRKAHTPQKRSVFPVPLFKDIPAYRAALYVFCTPRGILHFLFQAWDISNYGALMIAADLKAFENLAKRSVRIIRYPDKSQIGGIGEKTFYNGYSHHRGG